MDRRMFLSTAGALAAQGGFGVARAAEPLKVVAFAGASNLPFWAGQAQGFFAREDVEPSLEITPNSVELARNMMAGRYDLALTSIDNVVAYDENEGEVDLGRPADFVALFGVDDGMLSVMAASDVPDLKSLKGVTLSVDAMTTGFAFTLLDVLARNGLSPDEVAWAKVGGGAQRLEALLKGEQKATLLNTPLDLVAEARGFKRLARIRDLYPYQGICAMTRRPTALAKAASLRGFARGFRASVAWLAEPANKEAAVALLTTKMTGMPKPAAEKAYDRLLDPQAGIYRDLRIDRAGVATVLDLRSRYAPSRRKLADADRYIDATFLESL